MVICLKSGGTLSPVSWLLETGKNYKAKKKEKDVKMESLSIYLFWDIVRSGKSLVKTILNFAPD